MGEVPDPALIVLIGPSGSGKSSWAEQRYRQEEIVSSDRLRALVGSGEHDLDASEVAFDILDRIVAARVGRHLTAVVDTIGFDTARRHRHRQVASEAGMPAVAVLFETPENLSRARNRTRQRPVPAAVLTGQFRRLREVRAELEKEGWDLIVRISDDGRAPARAPEPAPALPPPNTGLALYLQLSRFPSQVPLGSWLSEMGTAAESAGFRGLAVMDHLVQIPQVGREWDNIVEAYTALAFLDDSTSRLQVGTLVTGVTLRNPALLAKIVASLDALSERLVQLVLADFKAQGGTVVMIAHRLASVTRADLIVVLEGGAVRESGTHQELMRSDAGSYRRLWVAQNPNEPARDEATHDLALL